jgi:hypothetical protein
VIGALKTFSKTAASETDISFDLQPGYVTFTVHEE